ncbi:MAG: DUF4126 domain-containing protein [Anaerolineales bacterium]|nr:DUF4126 domain-containing protein [Anaerolineales bacterium]
MLSAISSILTALGLSSASGLNAYIPLLIVALTARYTDWIKLNAPFDLLANEFVIVALIILLAIEVIVDKIPAADSLNDAIQTFVRPAAGALLFAASTNAIDMHPVLAAILGLVLAFGVHAVKATARPVVTASTGGLGNAFVSVGEDVVSAGVSIVAIIVPFVIGIVLAAIVMWFVFFRRRAPT